MVLVTYQTQYSWVQLHVKPNKHEVDELPDPTLLGSFTWVQLYTKLK